MTARQPEGPPTTIDFSPELVELTRNQLKALLGATWDRIRREDNPLLPDADRHLLALLDQNAMAFRQEYADGRVPGHWADFVAYFTVVQTLERARNEQIFPEVVSGLASRPSFRHDIVTLGLGQHLRRYTAYPVRFVPRSVVGERTVDLILGDSPSMNIEAKSPVEFEGPVHTVSFGAAAKAVRKAWGSAFGGPRPQVPDDSPSAILVGGVTLQAASLPTIAKAATAWLTHHGPDHPNCWGFLALTFVAYSQLPAGRTWGDGMPMTVDSWTTPELVWAANPGYVGPVKLNFFRPDRLSSRSR